MFDELRKSPVTVLVPPFGISAFRSRHAIGFQMAVRQDVYDKVVFVDAGQGILNVKPSPPGEQRQLPLTVGTTVLISSGIVHQIVDQSENPLTLSVVCLKPGLIEEKSPIFQSLWQAFKTSYQLPRFQQLSNSYCIGEFKRMFRELVVELGQDLPHRDAAALARVVQVLTLLTREVSSGRARARTKNNADFDASLAYLDDHFTEPLQVEELARIAGLSYRAFTSRFKQKKGMTTAQYWNHLRIELAKRRLLETRDIFGSALDAGFHDLSHFYKVFKRQVGETPMDFLSHPNARAASD